MGSFGTAAKSTNTNKINKRSQKFKQKNSKKQITHVYCLAYKYVCKTQKGFEVMCSSLVIFHYECMQPNKI